MSTLQLFESLPPAASASGPVIRLRAAEFSKCRRYRWTLTRAWDSRPSLLVVMFNPSDANESSEDPTVRLVCQIADHNGFGSIVVVNLVPIVSSSPDKAFQMLDWMNHGPEWGDRDLLQHNLSIIEAKAAEAAGVLLAPGALAARDDGWLDHVEESVRAALPMGAKVFCLGRTAKGYPKHPLARGRHKVPKNAPLLPWSTR